MKWDVVYYDTMSHPFSRRINAKKPCGGTELNHVKIVHGLADAGYLVLVLNNNSRGEVDGGVVYDHFSNAPRTECKVLVVCRFSELPNIRVGDEFFVGTVGGKNDFGIKADHIVMAMNDQFQEFQREKYIPGSTVILNSPWHAENFPTEWPKKVVPALVDDFVYELPPKKKNKNKFICASAVCKGLRPTLELWKEIKQLQEIGDLPGLGPVELHVTTAGHDRLPVGLIESYGAKWIGELSPTELLEELRTAAGLFFVNVLPETFCVLAAVAEAVGCRCHILALARGAVFTTCAGPYVTADREKFVTSFQQAYEDSEGLLYPRIYNDFSVSTVIPQWIEALGLTKGEPVEEKPMGTTYEVHEQNAKRLEGQPDKLLEYADECRMALMPERALDAYKRCPNETRAWIEASRLSLQLGLRDDETVPLVVEAAKRSAEAIEFVRTFRDRSNWSAMYVAAKALYREDDWQTCDELGIACYYLEKYEEGKAIYEKLLPKNIVPESEYKRVEMNCNFCLHSLGLPSYKREPTAAPEPPGFGAQGIPAHSIGIYPHAVDLKLCEDLIAVFDGARACEVTHRLDFEWRRCTIMHLPEAEMACSKKLCDRLLTAIKPFVMEYKKNFSPNSILNFCTAIEQPSIILYEPNEGASRELFAQHGDNWDMPSSTRQLSIILYLNHVEEGGETVFPEFGCKVAPRAGTLLLFPSFYTHIHLAEPPKSGDKLCMVTWLHFPGGQYATFSF